MNIEKPIIIFIDGHKSHLSLKTSDLCKQLGIVLISLYPNATRILQPADVAAFKPVKGNWKKAVHEWIRQGDNEIIVESDLPPAPFAFASLTKEMEPDIPEPLAEIEASVEACQRFNSKAWCNIRYLEAQKELQGAGSFAWLQVNPELSPLW
ncbi:hypothetical protein WDU94_010766 [Cyamophila willieti]